MICNNCGAENLEGNKFCSNCGKNISTTPPALPTSKPLSEQLTVFMWGVRVPPIVSVPVLALLLCCILTIMSVQALTRTGQRPAAEQTSSDPVVAAFVTQTRIPPAAGVTATPIPTESRRATTSAPILTPKPTTTLIPPTKVPAPLIFNGKGDSVVDANNPYPVAIVHITGNAESRFFAVTNYGKDGSQIDLLVNTTEPYDGVRALDFGNNEHTTRFQVQSSGSWTILLSPVSAARQLNVPGTIRGRGDDVLHLTGGKPDLAKITGNASRRFFAVEGYSSSVDLLVNTTAPYAGTVILNSATMFIVVSAIGDWTIEVTSK